MAVLLCSTSERADLWKEALAEHASGMSGGSPFDLRIWPDGTGDPDDIEYAVVANPPPGVLSGFPNLKAVFSLWAGVEKLVQDPTLPDVPLFRMVDEGLTRGMSEYVAGWVLHYHLRFGEYIRQKAEGIWKELDAPLASDRTVAVLGLGELGRDAALTLAGLGFRVIGWSRSEKQLAGVICLNGREGFERALRESTIVVCLLPRTPQTEGILDRNAFDLMPTGSVLINPARGAHVVDGDLISALDSGRLSGATLDVFDEEPLPSQHPFWKHPKVVITPHIASVTRIGSGAHTIIRNIERFSRGEDIPGRVDRMLGY